MGKYEDIVLSVEEQLVELYIKNNPTLVLGGRMRRPTDLVGPDGSIGEQEGSIAIAAFRKEFDFLKWESWGTDYDFKLPEGTKYIHPYETSFEDFITKVVFRYGIS